MGIGVMALKAILVDIIGMGSGGSNFGKKTTLIYHRLLDIIFKLDHIECGESGKEYLNMTDLVIDKRLNEKYEVLRIVWSQMGDPGEMQSKDWSSILDAIQKDLT